MAHTLPVLREEPAQRYRDADGVLWERTGSCNRCGSCCAGDPFNGELGQAQVHGYCPLFAWHGDAGYCSDRTHAVYINGCASFPQRPRQLRDHPRCSYVFRRVEE